MLTIDESNELQKIIDLYRSDFDNGCDDKLHEEYCELLNGTKLIQGYKSFEMIKSFRLKTDSSSEILILNLLYSINTGKQIYERTETQIFGFKKLKKNYGHLLISPESIEDKIRDWFEKSDIDFKDFPKFSSKYLFQADDKNKAESFATAGRLNLIEQQTNIIIEVKNDLLVAKYPRNMNSDDFYSMTSFLKKLDK